LYIGTQNDMFGDIMQHMVNDNLSFLSISWGNSETNYTSDEIENENTYFKNFSDLGIGITAATGDNGSNDGVGGNSNNCDFPSSSPYITACGGTNLVCPNYVYDNQTIETAWTSGGGAVSVKFSKPSYQNNLNVSGRSVPDIAMVADPNTGCFVKVNNTNYIIGGTSLVAPLFAGFLATINYSGFINNRLYNLNKSCFNDITSGNNGGYNANIGYDNCTGLGSINGVNLLNYLNQPDISSNPSGLCQSITPFCVPVGGSLKLLPFILPINSTNKTIQWTSSNTNIATINNNYVNGISNGIATITGTTQDGSNIATNFDITVYTKINNINLVVSSLSLDINSTYQIIPIVDPINSSDSTVFYSSSNNNIATVSNIGLITAIGKGNTTITCTSWDNLTSSSINLSVIVPITSIKLSSSSLKIKVGQIYVLNATILPLNANSELVSWTSSNPIVVSVINGKIRGLKKGISTIKLANLNNTISSTCTITVN
jgi:uncharacterized protein YjdB